MDKDKVIDYVMNSPANTNRAVLEGMLDGIAQGGGGAEPLIVTHTDDIDVGVTRLNVTFGELFEAFESRASIYSYYDDGSNKEWREMASIGRSDDDQYGHSGWIQFGDSERYNTEWLSTEEAMLQAYPFMPLD